MKRVVLIAIVLLTVCGASAQKFPERRETRAGTKLYKSGDYVGAETSYRRALEMNPELREASFNLGNALWMQQKPDEAAEAWGGVAADSLAGADMRSAASYNVGNVALAGKKVDDAIESYKAALRLRPDDMDAKYNLAYALKMRQQQNQDNKDQNKDQNQDKNQDKNSDDNSENKQDNNSENNQDNKPENDQQQPENQGKDGGGGGIDKRTAEQLLDAMQAAENDTREKVEGERVQVGARSGKNW